MKNDEQGAGRTLGRYVSFLRSLALLPVAASLAQCGPGGCPEDQRLGLWPRDRLGNEIPPVVAAQCENPGPAGSPCSAAVTCVSAEHSCCGQWSCTDRPHYEYPDANSPTGFVWERRICRGGPLAPPELAA